MDLNPEFSIAHLRFEISAGPHQVGSDTFEVVGRCIRCQAIDIDPEDAESHGPSLLAALATAQRDGVAGSTGKGPTFGVLLRKHQWQKLPVLEIGMSLHTA